jgi:hypothetical protein
MQRTVRFSAIAAMTSLLSVVILISAAHFDVAQAQKGRAAARACGQELTKQCSAGALGFSLNIQPIIQGPDVLQCLRKNRENLSARCVALAEKLVRGCERDAERHCKGVVLGQGNILGCLTTSKRVVSARCNAALDAAYLRQ